MYHLVGKVSMDPEGHTISWRDVMHPGHWQRCVTTSITTSLPVMELLLLLLLLLLQLSLLPYATLCQMGTEPLVMTSCQLNDPFSCVQMSFEVADVENTSLADLEEKQLKVLDDWAKKLSVKYPIVGDLA